MSFCSRNPGLYDRIFRFSQACQKVFFSAFFGDTKISDKILYLFFSDSRQDLCIGGCPLFSDILIQTHSKIPKKSRRRKRAKPRYFRSEIALRPLKTQIFLTPSGKGKNEKKKKK